MVLTPRAIDDDFTLTEPGLARLKAARPAHLAGVQGVALDHIDPADLSEYARVTEQLLQAIEVTSAEEGP